MNLNGKIILSSLLLFLLACENNNEMERILGGPKKKYRISMIINPGSLVLTLLQVHPSINLNSGKKILLMLI